MANAGRPKNEGQPRKYVVADDVHEWIISHGGGRYVTELIRALKAQYSLDNMANRGDVYCISNPLRDN